MTTTFVIVRLATIGFAQVLLYGFGESIEIGSLFYKIYCIMPSGRQFICTILS